jgi:hypothetical protein
MLGRNSSAMYDPVEPAEPNVGGTSVDGTGGGEGDAAGDALRSRSRCGERFKRRSSGGRRLDDDA